MKIWKQEAASLLKNEMEQEVGSLLKNEQKKDNVQY
jgi:hypothetical protein